MSRFPRRLGHYALPGIHDADAFARSSHTDLAGMTPRDLFIEKIRVERATTYAGEHDYVSTPYNPGFMSAVEWLLWRLQRIAEELASRGGRRGK